MIPFLAFALPFGLFVALPSTLWNFDGVACAVAAELGNPLHYFHSNHLLYGFLAAYFWRALCIPFGYFRALAALQLLSSLLSAVGLAGLCVALRHVGLRPRPALILTWALAVTSTFWVWSVEAQVYPLGFAALAWAAALLLSPKDSVRRWAGIGLLQGLAVLGHVMHLLWTFPALYWLWQHHRGPAARRRFQAYGSALATSVAGAYLLVMGLVIWPHHPGSQWFDHWLKGSVGLSADRHWSWHWAGWSGPWSWAKTSAQMFWGSFWPYNNFPVSSLAWASTLLSIGLLLVLLIQGLRARGDRPLRNMALVWLAAYGVFFWTWEPSTYCYRMTDILPVALLVAVAFKSARTAWWPEAASAALFASWLGVSLPTQIVPMHDPLNNRLYQQTLLLAKRTPENALFLTEGGAPWLYLLYFVGRPAWNVQQIPVPWLLRDIARHKTWLPIFVHTSLLRDSDLQSWIDHSSFRPVSAELPWVQLL